MQEKIYLKDVEDLTNTSRAGEKVFVEYGEKIEEIEGSTNYGDSDWAFTIKVLSNLAAVKFFKFIQKS